MATQPHPPKTDPFAPRALDAKVLSHVGTGLGLAVLAFAIPCAGVALHGLVTLAHEMGHALFGCYFARPSVPAFDLNFGGGVTMIQDPSPSLRWLILAAHLAAAAFFFRNRAALIFFGVLAGLYALLAFTHAHETVISFMGHGFELVIAGIFLYRGWSGSAVINPLERPLYSACGFFIVLWDVWFSFRLATSATNAIGTSRANSACTGTTSLSWRWTLG
ncbi:MAG: hypothetical protein HY291_01660 [Planctomycetes bacterium]|nr:hypothetical protein [Planctomycetota bacterium]